ncbi:transposable element Tcb1 transposase [Trichonephila clavipes]|nr:transposable element Tcb1 transposase [Trichonephila clavipes]
MPRFKRPPISVVWKLGDWVPVQASSFSLDHIPRVAEYCDSYLIPEVEGLRRASTPQVGGPNLRLGKVDSAFHLFSGSISDPSLFGNLTLGGQTDRLTGTSAHTPQGSRTRILSWAQKIGSRVGRNKTTVIRICDRWVQKGTTDRRGRSYPLQYNTSLSARTIGRRLQQRGLSARLPLLCLPLTQSHRRLRRQWFDERRIWAAEWNEVVFTDESRICLQHHDGRIRVWRHRGERMLNSCIMHRHTCPAPGIMMLEPVVIPYLQGLATSIFQQDNARAHVVRIVQRFFVNHQIEFLPWPARSQDLSPIGNMWSTVAHRLTQIPPPAATPDQLWQCVEAAWSTVLQEHIQSIFESMTRRVAVVISNNGGYCGY